MSITRVWIAGAGGRLGSALYHRFSGNTDYKLVTSDRDVPIEDAREAGRFADLNHPDVIINCAGLTDVRACEEKPEEAYKINAIGARNLAVAARRIDAKLIQISTDDVFDGDDDAALCEFDDAHPTTMYGKSKYAGEKLVRELTDKHVIVRSSWLYGVGSYDFVDRVLDNAKKDGKVVLPEDEISSPTSADALAGFIECLMHTREFGLYHASCDGSCSRAEWAREILRLNGMDNIPVISAAENTELRPRFTLLDNMMLRITRSVSDAGLEDRACGLFQHEKGRCAPSERSEREKENRSDNADLYCADCGRHSGYCAACRRV